MMLLTTRGFPDYELLDSGLGYRYERFGTYRLVRPDPQAIWQRTLPEDEWGKADALFEKTTEGKERWVNKNNVPTRWLMHYQDIAFWAELSPFKHTGVFPEQVLQWEFITKKITKEKKQLSILNLFAYTGVASLVASKAGAKVTHVDASKPTIAWARENQAASGLQDKPIRWILDDAIKFTEREARRGVQYDGVIMDPPVYGHGPNGEKWDFNESFPILLHACKQVLSDRPVFIIINAYAISASSIMLENMLQDMTKGMSGKIESGELALRQRSNRLLSTGIFGRWVR